VGKPLWGTEPHLGRLYHWELQRLYKHYPAYQPQTIKSKKYYWSNKINRGEIEVPPNPEQAPPHEGHLGDFGDILKLHNMTPELAKEFGEQGFHVGYIKNNDGEIEYTIPLPSAKRRVGMEQFEQAKPAKITPAKTKPVKRDHKRLFVFSDAQIDYRRLDDNTLMPIHDERAMRASRLLCKDLQPDEIINLGDTVDLSALSRFKPDSDHFYRTLGHSFQRVHDYYAELRADNPNAKITEVDSNHNTRLKDFVLKNAPQLYNIKRPGETDDYPVMTYPYLANLGHIGVNWISGYGAAEYVYGEEYGKPPIVFKHGNSVVSGGSTVAKESRENAENHVVRGHGHRMETHTRTTRAGHYLSAVMLGTLCKITGEVPSYHSAVDDLNKPVKYQENWQTGVMVIYDYDGQYQFDHIPIVNGVIKYNGKEYSEQTTA
jgi:hypothetical protein